MKNRSEVGYLVLISLSLTVVLAVYNDVHSLRKALSNNFFAINNESRKSDFSASPVLVDCLNTFNSDNTYIIRKGRKEHISTLQINDILLIINRSPFPVFPIIFTLPEVVKSFISPYKSHTDNDYNTCFQSNCFFEISISEYAKVINPNIISLFSGLLPEEQPVRAGPTFTSHLI